MITEAQLQNRVAIGAKIAQIRQEKRITQENLASMTGLDRANISKIERGRYNVSIDIVQRVCEALDCRLDIVKAAE